MTANEWCLWFVKERMRLHDILVKHLAKCTDFIQKVKELYEHDAALHQLGKYTQKRVARANLVSLFAYRENKLSSEQEN